MEICLPRVLRSIALLILSQFLRMVRCQRTKGIGKKWISFERWFKKTQIFSIKLSHRKQLKKTRSLKHVACRLRRYWKPQLRSQRGPNHKWQKRSGNPRRFAGIATLLKTWRGALAVRMISTLLSTATRSAGWWTYTGIWRAKAEVSHIVTLKRGLKRRSGLTTSSFQRWTKRRKYLVNYAIDKQYAC